MLSEGRARAAIAAWVCTMLVTLDAHDSQCFTTAVRARAHWIPHAQQQRRQHNCSLCCWYSLAEHAPTWLKLVIADVQNERTLSTAAPMGPQQRERARSSGSFVVRVCRCSHERRMSDDVAPLSLLLLSTV